MEDENNIPEGWLMTFLGDITNYIRRGITPKYCENESVFVINQRCIRDNKVSLLNARFHDLSLKDVGDEKRLKSGDILICSTGVGTLGRVAQYKLNDTLATVDSHVTIVRPNDNIFKPFLGLLLSGKEREIEFLAEGTTGQTELPRTSLGLLQINLPPLPEQKAIAKVLTAFDDKIELLQAQNKTLETMAQTIFKEWFGKYQVGDELPEGWRVGRLGEIASLKSGFAFKSKDFVEDSNKKALKIKDLKGDGKVSLQQLSSVSNDVTESSRVQYFKLKEGDIVLAMSGNTTGKIGVIPPHSNEVYLNQRVGKFFMVKKDLNSYLYSFLMSGNYEEKILSMGYGSAQPNISPSQIENIDIICPNEAKLVSFLKISNPIFMKVLDNNNQIQILTKTRDTLLPKLMSGQVRVKNIKHTADA